LTVVDIRGDEPGDPFQSFAFVFYIVLLQKLLITPEPHLISSV